MSSRLPAVALLLVALAAQLVFAAPARADTSTQCTGFVGAWPKVITAPGVYCLVGNLSGTLSTNQAAITINASNVIVDCNGYTLTETSGVAGTRGVSFGNRDDIEVRNCRLANFGQGIHGGGTNRRVFVRGNTISGAHGIALQLAAHHGGVFDNRVVDTTNAPAAIYVIVGSEGFVMVNGNIVRNVNGATAGIDGIWIYGTGHAQVQDNIVSGVGGGTTTVAGAIRVGSTGASVPTNIQGNTFYNPTALKSYPVLKSGATSKSRCANNLATGGTWQASLGCL
jgi:Periplasmic copper-binding protein (NosD)